MGLYIIFEKAFLSLLGPKRTISLLVLGVLLPGLFTWFQWSDTIIKQGTLPLTMQTQLVADWIVTFWYIWGAGFLLMMIVIATAAGFIAGEVSEGTMMVLAVKPVRRYQIVLGKLLGLITYAMLLLAFTYTFSILLLWSILGLDMDSVEVLLGLLPALLLYGLLVILFFGSITIALSVLTSSRVKIMMACMVLVVLTFFGGIGLRFMFLRGETGVYRDVKLYIVDVGYHLGNTYDLVTGSVSFWDMSPQQLDILGMLNGAYSSPIRMDAEGVGVYYLPNRFSYMHPAVSLMILLLVSVGATGLAVWRFNRKQL